MKKVKNIELRQAEVSSEKTKDGKVKKSRHKAKKLKDVTKLAEPQLPPKIEQTSGPSENHEADKPKKKNKKNKNKLAHQQENLKESEDKAGKLPQESVTEKNSAKKKKKQKKAKKEKVQKEISQPSTDNTQAVNHKELTAAELKKIEKKKAKKLAQKLKKKQKLLKASEANNKDSSETNGVENEQPTDKDRCATSTKVLTKKEKKVKKRQLIKEQKLIEKQTRDPAVEMATVFVGNLPVNTKRIQLINLFKNYAPVNSIRLRTAGGKLLRKHKDRKTAGSLNAYVVLKDKETAEKAISLNGAEFKGHHLRITLAAKNQLQSEKEGGKRTIFVGNLKYSTTEEDLREVFSSCGEIDYIRCLRDGDKGCKGVAYVCFKTPDSVGLALELNETLLDERPIHVERYSVKKLGAKEARDAQAEKEKSTKKGAKQRIDGKNLKNTFAQKQNNQKSEDDKDKKQKKSKFRGVKIESLKKKQKLKKKKSNNQMLELAKKIAPKSV